MLPRQTRKKELLFSEEKEAKRLLLQGSQKEDA
jgi:hypothetical protein